MTPEVTGPELAKLVDRGTESPGKSGAAGFGDWSVAEPGLPLFTIALGLIGGFNPYARWALLFLLVGLSHLLRWLLAGIALR